MESLYKKYQLEGLRKHLASDGVCAMCGYDVFSGDDAVTVNANGRMLHRDCWEDYASENADEFLTAV